MTESKELTPRESQCADRIIEGLSNREIAEQLGIAEKSVKMYCGQLYKKAGVKSRSQFMALVIRELREERSQVHQIAIGGA